MVEENKQAIASSADILAADTALVRIMALGDFVSKLIMVHSAVAEISYKITTPISFRHRQSAASCLELTSNCNLLLAV